MVDGYLEIYQAEGEKVASDQRAEAAAV